MTLTLRTEAGSKPVVRMRVRTAAGLKEAERGRLRNTTNALKVFFSKFAASVDKTAVHGSRSSAQNIFVTAGTVTASAQGAVGAVSYLWELVSNGDNTSWSITNPTSATTAFGADVESQETTTATFKCTVTDSAGNSAETSLVNAVATNPYFKIGVT